MIRLPGVNAVRTSRISSCSTCRRDALRALALLIIGVVFRAWQKRRKERGNMRGCLHEVQIIQPHLRRRGHSLELRKETRHPGPESFGATKTYNAVADTTGQEFTQSPPSWGHRTEKIGWGFPFTDNSSKPWSIACAGSIGWLPFARPGRRCPIRLARHACPFEHPGIRRTGPQK